MVMTSAAIATECINLESQIQVEKGQVLSITTTDIFNFCTI